MRFLVIGLGSMGKRRIRCLRTLGMSDIAGYDPRADRVQEASDTLGVRTFDRWQDAVDFGAHAWIVSTPPDRHMEYALQAVEQGVHFFTEAGVPDERATELIKRLAASSVVGVPSCTMRFLEGPSYIRGLLAEGAIGRPLQFTYQSGQYLPDWHPWESYRDFYVSRRETGGAREIVPFELVWLMGLLGPIETVSCFKAKLSDLDADIDDAYHLILAFDSGILGHLCVDVVARPAVRFFRLNGTEGTVEWNKADNTVRLFRTKCAAWEHVSFERGTVERGYIQNEEPYIEEIRSFLAAITGESAFPYSFEEDERVLDVLLRAENSVAERRHI